MSASMTAIVGRRRLTDGLVVALAYAMTALALGMLGLILFGLTYNGLAALSLDLFTQATPPPGGQGGLRNAIIGSLIMTVMAMALAVPVGILAGTYLAEYGRGSRFAESVRFINDILLSAPSIMIGLCVYEIAVAPVRHFSALAGALALALIGVPIIVRTTENMLRLVPDATREAAAALGAPKWRVCVFIVYRAAFQGLTTGVLLALSRVAGETAPLIFTALNNQFDSYDLTRPMASLPVVIFQFAMSPYQDWRQLAWGGAFLITLAVLVLNILSRLTAPTRIRA